VVGCCDSGDEHSGSGDTELGHAGTIPAGLNLGTILVRGKYFSYNPVSKKSFQLPS
jgi:hypothetical protein